MLLSETERRHVELMAATILAGRPDEGHKREQAAAAVSLALHIRDHIRDVYRTEEETP